MKHALLLLLASLPACRGPKPREVPTERVYDYAFTHAAGKPCAPGYQLRARFFTERDGTTEDACALATGLRARFTLDELKGGESIELRVPLSGVLPQAVRQ